MAARGARCTRREFLWRTAALGFAAPSLATLLDGCATARPSGTPAASGTAGPSSTQAIVPVPTQATYAGIAPFERLACEACPEGRVRDALLELAQAVGTTLVFDAPRLPADAALAVHVDAGDLPAQGYRLDVTADGGAARIEIHGRDDPGAFYGLQSLGQLIATESGTRGIRIASVRDEPGFPRRGAILDTNQPPTAQDRLAQLDRVRFGARFKMNLLSLPDATPEHSLPDAALIAFCDAHFIELLSMVGFKHWLTRTPRAVVKDFLRHQVDLGIRSFSLNWDDIGMSMESDPDALVLDHAEVLNDVYAFLRALDPSIRVSATLPPYGGIPGVNLGPGRPDGSGERYLELMRDRMPDDVTVFWTGDGGIFSHAVTTDGARAYASAIGHPIALWDNVAMSEARQGMPIIGGDADLPEAVEAYMGNLAAGLPVTGDETSAADDAKLTLVTALDYAWNPVAYDRDAAMWRAAPWVPSWRGPRPIPSPHPLPIPSVQTLPSG